MVVLPQPDSPTSASVRPAAMLKLTPRTASKAPMPTLQHTAADREANVQVLDLEQQRLASSLQRSLSARHAAAPGAMAAAAATPAMAGHGASPA